MEHVNSNLMRFETCFFLQELMLIVEVGAASLRKSQAQSKKVKQVHTLLIQNHDDDIRTKS